MKNTFTKYDANNLCFDIVVDETLHRMALSGVVPSRKALLSLVNDYESGAWRIAKFEDFIWDNIKETALSKTERDALVNREHSSLVKSASNVKFEKTGDNRGGEIGEILLYGVMKHYYSALPVVPKIFYKQNENDYAKGADSVHIIVETDGSFSFWMGESKFYNTADKSRFAKIFESIESMLEEKKLRKEANIVTSMKDIDLVIPDRAVAARIKAALADGVSLDTIKTQLHIPILLLHQCTITSSCTGDYKQYMQDIKEEHLKVTTEFMLQQESKLSHIYGYDSICFHLILFPVPNKKNILKRFMSTVGFYKKGRK